MSQYSKAFGDKRSCTNTHRKIIDDMVEKQFITRINEPWGSKTIIKYKVSEKGREILKQILEPYETLFPRSETVDGDDR